MLLFFQNQFDGEMPHYFKFLTIMAFHVFLKEKVFMLRRLRYVWIYISTFSWIQIDVGILEVGIGGQYDCTNIIR